MTLYKQKHILKTTIHPLQPTDKQVLAETEKIEIQVKDLIINIEASPNGTVDVTARQRLQKPVAVSSDFSKDRATFKIKV